jgi:hypothetical protein
MKVFLKVKSVGKEGFFQASIKHISIGRGDKADIKIDDNNCSRVHCKFYVAGEALWVEDLASKNGTYVNGVEKNKAKLFLNDKVLIGDTEITVTDEKNTTTVRELLKYKGSINDKDQVKIEIEDQELLTEVRMNPLTALKKSNIGTTRASSNELDSNPLFRDSRNAVPTFKKKQVSEKDIRRKRNVASLIDLFIFTVAFFTPPYFFWFAKKTEGKMSIIGNIFDIKQIIIVASLSLLSVFVIWFVSTRGDKGTIGERLLNLRDLDDNF